MDSMRAAVWVGGRNFEIQEQPVPTPGDGQVRIRVYACGVCLTDVHTIDGLLGPSMPPRILGHEWGGTVGAIGAGVAGLKVVVRIGDDAAF